MITDSVASSLPWIYNVQANSNGGLTPALQSEIHHVPALNPAGAHGWLVWDGPSRPPMESAAVFAGEHVAGKLVMTSLPHRFTAIQGPIIMAHSSPSSRPRGFTLVELLVVIAIIGILIGMLLPAVNAAREAARRAQCMNNLKQMGIAVNMYHDAIGNYPQGRNTRDPMGVSWAFRLLPYMEQQSIYDAYDPDHRVDANENALAMRTPVEVYFCPSRRSPTADRNFDNNNRPPLVTRAAAGGDYAANTGVYLYYRETENVDPQSAGPIYTYSKIRNRQVTDGTSKTFAVGERHVPPPDPSVPEEMRHVVQGDCAFLAADSPWGIFADTRRGLANSSSDHSRSKYGSEHPAVTLFVYLDGHIDAIDNNTDLDVLNWLCAIGDGNDPNSGIGLEDGDNS